MVLFRKSYPGTQALVAWFGSPTQGSRRRKWDPGRIYSTTYYPDTEWQ